MKKLLVFGAALALSGVAFSQDWSAVEKIFGKKGTIQGHVFKISFPRTDIHVSVGDFNVTPGLALGSWVGILDMGNQAMMMGDMVLLDKEVQPAMKKLVEEGLQVSALHNHLVGETPSVKYMHFSGTGEANALAEKIRAVFEVTATPLDSTAPSTAEAPDWSKVQAILGPSGKTNGKLLQYAFARNERLTESNMEMPAFMGMATAINFQADGDRAGCTGDFVLLADEVNPVVKALMDGGIAVTAIHNHMLYDNPRLFMLHFWGVGKQEMLAATLKAALDKTNSKR